MSQYINATSAYDKERKIDRRKINGLLKRVCAFLNTDGGTIIFGIDGDDNVVGLRDPKGDAEFLKEAIKTRITPLPKIQIQFIKLSAKTLLLLNVFKDQNGPYYYIGGECINESYIRVGDESIIAHRRNLSFDALPSIYKLDELDFSSFKYRYKSWTKSNFDNKLFRSLGLINRENFVTNAGLLFADDNECTQNTICCTRWYGNNKTYESDDVFDSDELNGSLIFVFSLVLNFIRRNTRTLWYKEPTQRIEISEYRMRSVTEILVNALAHRDYLIKDRKIHVDIFDDRLEICSPGGMPKGQIIQNMNLLTVPSIPRNPIIANILSALGYMEQKGNGFSKLSRDYRNLPYFCNEMLPTFYSDQTKFLATFPNIVKIWISKNPHMMTS